MLIQFSKEFDKENMFQKKRCNTCGGKKNKKVNSLLCLFYDHLALAGSIRKKNGVCKGFEDDVSLRGG